MGEYIVKDDYDLLGKWQPKLQEIVRCRECKHYQFSSEADLIGVLVEENKRQSEQLEKQQKAITTLSRKLDEALEELDRLKEQSDE